MISFFASVCQIKVVFLLVCNASRGEKETVTQMQAQAQTRVLAHAHGEAHVAA